MIPRGSCGQFRPEILLCPAKAIRIGLEGLASIRGQAFWQLPVGMGVLKFGILLMLSVRLLLLSMDSLFGKYSITTQETF
jgi:hypothetical protein